MLGGGKRREAQKRLYSLGVPSLVILGRRKHLPPSAGIECAHGHLDRPFGAQCHRCFRFHCLAWNYFKSPTAQNFSQHNPKLHPGEAFTNAGSWSTAKREESILRQGTLKFRRPTIRIEFGRVRKIPVGAVNGPLASQNNRTFGYACSSDLQIMRCSPADSPNRRIKAQGFADDPRSEEHTSDCSHTVISYAVFCLKKKKSRPFPVLDRTNAQHAARRRASRP